ncbi:FAD/NAD(P)-binding domain-containing protein [Pluteus cervinus]|uniref:FAD/NAD(P)-binding domain-containing protein n=1 Tax=Pluteus cervinus TaxID=181527 RepID=A0ACD3AYD7_9AGAR|nr:FAD/NAD(P)-binding domain-containing protein [Pluteus cervinus]
MSRISKDFTIAVVGGGMVGLACAIPLSRAGLNVTIFESAKEFGEVGAGVGLARNGLRALKGLGLLDPIYSRLDAQSNHSFEGFEFLSGVGDHKSVFMYPTKPDELRISMYRPAYMSAVLPLLDPSIVQFGKRCILVTKPSASPPPPPPPSPTSTTDSESELMGGQNLRPRLTTLHFSDGSTFTADLVIGADGVKSVTRKYITGEENPHLGYTGHSVYRGLISMEDLRKAGLDADAIRRPICWFHRDRHIITFTVQNDTKLNVAAFGHLEPPITGGITGPWVENVSHEEVLDEYKGWGKDVQTIVEHMTTPSKWYIHAVSPTLKTFAKDQVVLVGDAAHAMLPHLGAGVNQGFEDAYALYRLLTHPRTNLSNLKHVLQMYSDFREPRANMVLNQTAHMGEIYEEYDGDDQKFVSSTSGIWTPVWRYDIDKEMDAFLVKSDLELLLGLSNSNSSVSSEEVGVLETGQLKSLL